MPGSRGSRAGPVTAARSRPAACPTCCPAAARSPTPAARVDAAASWGVDTLPEAPGRDGDAIVAALAAGELGGLVVGGVDPADTADPDATRAAIAAAGFVVALELRETDVTRAADVVFPVAPVTDKAGTFVNWEGRPRPFDAVLEQPRVAARPAGARRDRRGAGGARPGRPWASAPSPRRGRDGRDGAVGRRPRHRWRCAPSPRLSRPAGASCSPPGSRCSTTARCRTATSTSPRPPARPSPGSPATIYDALGPAVTVTGDRGSVTLPAEIADDLVDGVVWVPANSSGRGVLTDVASPGSRVTVKGADA